MRTFSEEFHFMHVAVCFDFFLFLPFQTLSLSFAMQNIEEIQFKAARSSREKEYSVPSQFLHIHTNSRSLFRFILNFAIFAIRTHA